MRLLTLAVVAALCVGCGQGDASNASAGQQTAAAAQASSTPSPADTPVGRCATAVLEPRVVQSGSTGSAPFVTVGLRNGSDRACEVAGYPQLTGRLLRERRGSLYEREDPGVHPVTLEPGDSAVFHVGTATAYDAPAPTITKLRFRLPDTLGTYVVPVHLETSRPPMRRIPVGVTALEHE